MKKAFIFKLLISFLFVQPVFAAEPTFVSLLPSISEIVYALNLEKSLVGVSSACNFPSEVKNKPRVGSVYAINKEKILQLRPTYVFALKQTEPFLGGLNNLGLKFVYFDFKNIADIHFAIETIGKLAGVDDRALELNKKIELDTKIIFKKNQTKILYVVQARPLITIGRDAFLSDVIEKSGNVSATKNLNGQYPSISLEYALKLKPDLIILGPYSNEKDLKFIFPKTKFVKLANSENDLINRPSPRVGEAVRFFSKF